METDQTTQQVMHRRSSRLKDNPNISYHENLFKVFKKIRRARTSSRASSNADSFSMDTPITESHSDALPMSRVTLSSKEEAPQASTASSCRKSRLCMKKTYGALLVILLFPCIWFFLPSLTLFMESNALGLSNGTDFRHPMADQMADFALETQGASVIRTRCSNTYNVDQSFVSVFGFTMYRSARGPCTVIQGHPLLSGRCWPFDGARGTLAISLAHPITITHVTLDHLSRYNHPTGSIDSAPKDFGIYGMKNNSEEGTLLGAFTYHRNGEQTQTFQIPNPSDEVYRAVRLQVLNNWGNNKYTCLYRFRVHGKIAIEKWLTDSNKESGPLGLSTITDFRHSMADKMADFALETQGASVIRTRCSETYDIDRSYVSLFSFTMYRSARGPCTVIQGLPVLSGRCWPFQGTEGNLTISLSHPITITHVTLDHLSRYNSPTGSIDSTPKDFGIYGMKNNSEEGTLLGAFTYDRHGEQTQTFKLPNPSEEVYRAVRLQVLNNWGNDKFTCLYRFRVHGKIANL